MFELDVAAAVVEPAAAVVDVAAAAVDEDPEAAALEADAVWRLAILWWLMPWACTSSRESEATKRVDSAGRASILGERIRVRAFKGSWLGG